MLRMRLCRRMLTLAVLCTLAALPAAQSQLVYNPSISAGISISDTQTSPADPSAAFLDGYALLISGQILLTWSCKSAPHIITAEPHTMQTDAENLLLKNGGDPLAAAREADDLFNVSRILAMDMAEGQKKDSSSNVRRATYDIPSHCWRACSVQWLLLSGMSIMDTLACRS